MAREPMPKIRNAKRTAKSMSKGNLRLDSTTVKSYNKSAKAGIKAKEDGADSKSARRGLVDKVSSSSYKFNSRKSLSPVKPSMPVKTGVKNKVKAQGSKSMSTPTMGYNKLGNKKK